MVLILIITTAMLICAFLRISTCYCKNPWKNTKEIFFRKNLKKGMFFVRLPVIFQKHEFDCGPSSAELLLHSYGIPTDTQSLHDHFTTKFEQKLGTSPWKLKKIINKIIEDTEYTTRINYFTTYIDIIKQVSKQKTVIVLFISDFEQYGFLEGSSYLHYACVQKVSPTHIYLNTPTSHMIYRGTENDGCIKLPLEEFYERFYCIPKYIEYISWLPTNTDSKRCNTTNNRINKLLRKGVLLLYHLRILHPGLSITLTSKRA